MKKIFTTAAIIGLIAVPSMAFASQGTDDTPGTPTNVKQEDRQANQTDEDRQANQPADANDDSAVTPNLPETASPRAVAAIAEAEARTIAQGHQPGKTIIKVERETEHGVDVFSVRFSDGSRVDVDASTGAILPADDDDSVTAAEDNSASTNQADSSGRGHQADNSGNSNRGRDHAED